MRLSFRLLPLTMTLAAVALAFKAGQVAEDSRTLLDHVISPVQAEEEKKEAAPEETPKTGEAAQKKEEPAATQKPPEPALPTTDGKEGNKAAEALSNQLGGIRPEDRRFSPQELELLQQLTRRREQLDEWEKNIALKENLLSATEKRVDEKLAEMEELKKELAAMLVQYNDQEDTKIKSLVRIYENMKPREAARIFDEVEMPILLLVIDKMSEKKAAPILASMDPKKAKQLTVELAEQRRIEAAELQAKKGSAAVPPAQ